MKALFTILIFASVASFGAKAAETRTNAVAEVQPARKSTEEILAEHRSVFEVAPKSGYANPFFPQKKIEEVNTQAQPVISSYDLLSLKGISGTAEQRLALINNQNLAAGETAMVRTSRGMVRVTCVEVKENSVIVKIEGFEPKEIFLSRKY